MTPAIDITTEQRKTLLAHLRRFIPGVLVWAYGSRVKWTARPNSDLDLVAFATPAQRPLISELKDALAESNLPFPVDLHIWDEVPQRFHEIIRKEFVVFQEADETEDKSVSRSWLYQPVFPKSWHHQSLYSLARWVNGLAFRDIQFTPTGKPVIKIAEIKGGISEQTKFTEQTFDDSVLVKNGDMLFSWSGQPETSIDAFWWRGTEGWLNQHSFKITPDSKLDRTFFFYILRYLKPSFVGIARNKQTTGLGHVTKRDLERIEVAFPPLPEQKSIAQILGALDDKIELNRRTNATLEAMARTLFQSWFVNFDPVRAKLDGRKSAGLNAATAALFPSTFQDSALGNIPKGWETGSILRQADLLSGGTPKTDVPSYWNGDVPWVSAKDVSQCGEAFLVSTERTITKLGVEGSSTKIVPANATVVVARGATTGRLTMFGRAMAMNQTCYGLRSKVGAPFALYCNIRHFIERLVQGGHGSIFDTITTSTFEATDVLLAPKEVLLAFDKQVTPLFEQVHANLHQSRTLATLRDSLLPKLLSGELSVSGAEKEVSA